MWNCEFMETNNSKRQIIHKKMFVLIKNQVQLFGNTSMIKLEDESIQQLEGVHQQNMHIKNNPNFKYERNTQNQQQINDPPTYSEIQKSLEVIKKVMPEALNDELINLIFARATAMLRNKEAQENQKKLKNNPIIQSLKRLAANNVPKNIPSQKPFNAQKMNILQFSVSKPQTICHSSKSKQFGYFQEPPCKQVNSWSQSFRTRSNKNESNSNSLLNYQQNTNNYRALQSIGNVKPPQITSKSDQKNKTNHSILNEVYDELQNLVYSHKTLIPVNTEETQKIIELLSKCQNNFSLPMRETICKMVRNNVNKTSQPITPQQAGMLYEQIHTLIKLKQTKEQKEQSDLMKRQRLKNIIKIKPQEQYPYYEKNGFEAKLVKNEDESKTNQTNQVTKSGRRSKMTYILHNEWTLQYERELLEYYKETSHFGTIRDRFKAKYPQSQKLFTSDSLRSKLYKLLRVSIRKLIYQVDHHYKNSSPSLIKLDDNRVKAIIYYQEGRQIKLLLLEFYMSKGFDKKLIVTTIFAVNEYICKMEQVYNSYNDNESSIAIAKRKRRLQFGSFVGSIRKKCFKQNSTGEKKRYKDNLRKKIDLGGENILQMDKQGDFDNQDDIFFEDEQDKQEPKCTSNIKKNIQHSIDVSNWLQSQFQ